MATADIKAAVTRVAAVLGRRPELGLHADVPALARWDRDVSATAQHPNGIEIRTDLPPQLGGKGAAVSPGWLMRAGVASCTVTSIALAAAAQGIELESLEVNAASHSDVRGVLGLNDADGPVAAAPRAIELTVRIAARGVSAERLRLLVEESRRRTPVLCALEQAVPVHLLVEACAP